MDRAGITLFLCGDVMTGRGVDQVLAHPGDPVLHEAYLRSAEGYVELAEQAVGPLPRSAAPAYVWGDALAELTRMDPDVRIVNLETAVTNQDRPWPDKGIHYRMHPANAQCLTVAGIDCCVLANNHVLDWSHDGLMQTLSVLTRAGIAACGAGSDGNAAWAPAVLDTPAGRIVVIGLGTTSSGIPEAWEAAADRPGVALLHDLGDREVAAVAAAVAAVSGDVVVASIHWGGNWGYRIPPAHRRFAHALIDEAGVHVVHGHSAHHPLGIEVYRERPILYGCGDFINDYEGIGGREQYRAHLGFMYFVTLTDGRLDRLELTPTAIRRFRVERAFGEDAAWLADVMSREGAQLGTAVEVTSGERLLLRW